MALSSKRSEQVSGGIFLIGIGLMLANVIPVWPGIMFVLGGAAIARGLAEGRGWYALQGGIWLIGIGLIFTFGFSLPLLLIVIGISMLLGATIKPPFTNDEKQKNEELGPAEEREPEDDAYEIGDDGELIKVKNDANLAAQKGRIR
jgi:hypothetical protein